MTLLRLLPPHAAIALAIFLAGLLIALLILLLGALAVLHAQSSPSISVALSPSHSVPMDTAITGAVTLSNLDLDSYSSVIFRADITPYRNAELRCNGDDTGKDIEIAVDESREVFTARIFDACPSWYRSYGSYTLDISISRVDTGAPNGKVELASTRTQFSMSRYMTIGEPTATPPGPGAQAWMDPDPASFTWYVGEWHQFRFRSNVVLYLNDHLGVKPYGSEPGRLVAPGEGTPSITVEEACRQWDDARNHWPRSINQGLWIAACTPGDVTIELRHETDAVAPLYVYNFRALAKNGTDTPEISIAAVTSPVAEGADAKFALTRSGPTTAALTVNVSVTESRSMLSGARPSMVAFAAGDAGATLTVATDDDAVVEAASVVTAEVQADAGAPPAYTVGAASAATVTVNDNDVAALTMSVMPSEVPEGSSSTVTVSAVGVTFSTSQTIGLTVTGPAEAGADFTIINANGQTLSPPYSITLPAGRSSVTAAIRAVADAEVEEAETIELAASHSGNVIGSATITIPANGAPPPPPPSPPPPPPPPITGGGSGGGGGGGGAPSNRSPLFIDGAATSRSVAENALVGQYIGAPVVARDPDGDTLAYTLSGADPQFFVLHPATGQLRVNIPLDYETKNSYSVAVRVADGRGAGGYIAVTVAVTNVGLEGMVGQYDKDDNGVIERDEAIAAAVDYFNGVISKEEAIAVIKVYFAG